MSLSKKRIKVAFSLILAIGSILVAFASASGNSSNKIQIPMESDNYYLTDGVADEILSANFEGFVGISTKHEAKEVDVFIHGSVPADLVNFISNHKDVKIKVIHALHSKDQLDKAVDVITKEYENHLIPEDVILSVVHAQDDGSGVLLSLDVNSSTPSETWISYLEHKVGVPIFISGERTNIHLLSSRTADISPWHGGALFYTWAIDPYPEACSAGFGVTSTTTGIDYLLGANHCFSMPTGQEVRTFDYLTFVGSWSSDNYHNFPSQDLALINPASGSVSNTVFYGGIGTQNVVQITGAARNKVDDKECIDGGNSGLHCDVRVVQSASSVLYNYKTYNNIVSGKRDDNTVIAATGDSGGPVVAYSQSGQFLGGGLIFLGNALYSCSDVNTPVNTLNAFCSNKVYWTDLTSDLALSHMKLKQ